MPIPTRVPSIPYGLDVPYARLGLILGIALLLRLALLSATPFRADEENRGLLGFNDELSHIHYVRYLAEHRHLPVQTSAVTDPDAFAHNEFEYYQPPLYYALSAPAYLLGEELGPGLGRYGARAISLLCGLLSLAAAYRLGSAFGPRLGLLTAALLSLSPVHLYFTSIATNDSLAWLLGTLFLSALLERPSGRAYLGATTPDLLRRPAGPLRLGLLLGAGLLAKSTFLTLLPLLFLRPLSASLRGLDPRPLAAPCLAAAIGLAMALPYYARNLFLYGSPLGLEAGHGPQVGWLREPTLHKAYEFLSWTAVTFWSPHNWPLGFHSLPVKSLIVVLSAVAIAVVILGWRRILRGVFPSPGNALLLWAAAGCAALGYAGYNLVYPQSDARLLFQAGAGFHALFALALVALVRRERAPSRLGMRAPVSRSDGRESAMRVRRPREGAYGGDLKAGRPAP